MRLLRSAILVSLLLVNSAVAAPVATKKATSQATHRLSNDPAVLMDIPDVELKDPYERFNRTMFSVNTALDKAVLRPITQGYQFIVPEPGRKMVHNFVDNIYAPVVFVNSVLQVDPQNSFATLWRFLLNSSFGVLGLFDFASEVGLQNRSADLGQTLGSYGVEPGNYLYLPIIGPSGGRDIIGRVGDMVIDPFNYLDSGVVYAKTGITILDRRSEGSKIIDDVYRNSLDPYATFRSGYIQKRHADVKRAIEGRNAKAPVQ